MGGRVFERLARKTSQFAEAALIDDEEEDEDEADMDVEGRSSGGGASPASDNLAELSILKKGIE